MPVDERVEVQPKLVELSVPDYVWDVVKAAVEAALPGGQVVRMPRFEISEDIHCYMITPRPGN